LRFGWCHPMLSQHAVGGCALTFPVERIGDCVSRIIWVIRWVLHRAFMFGHFGSSGLWTRSLGYLASNEFFFILTTWNFFTLCMVFRIVWRFRWFEQTGRGVHEANALKLNIGKCKLTTFWRLHHPVQFSYMLGGITLHPVDSAKCLLMSMSVRLWHCWDLWRECQVISRTLVCEGLLMIFLLIWLSVFRRSLLDMRCGYWGRRTYMIFFHTRTIVSCNSVQ
jgi:hypothetical protein